MWNACVDFGARAERFKMVADPQDRILGRSPAAER